MATVPAAGPLACRSSGEQELSPRAQATGIVACPAARMRQQPRQGPPATRENALTSRRQRVTPLTRATVTVLATYLDERAARPGTALFCGPTGQPLSRDALEHRLAKHLSTATSSCSSLAVKHITMHTLRHTAAMNLLAAGVDVSVIALWLGHADTHSTDAYLHADMSIKQAAIDRTRPLDVSPGTYKPNPDNLAWLTAL